MLTQWGIEENLRCDRCGADEQIVAHLPLECPGISFGRSLQELH